MVEILIGKIQLPFTPVSLRFATRCLLQEEHRTLMDESGIIITQMGMTVDKKMVTVAWDALYDTTP
jgi:hypothetical protein